MDLRKIRKLIELVEETGIVELEVRQGEETIRIVRPPPAPTPVAGSAAVKGLRPEVRTPATVRPAPGWVVKAPLAGTFYCAPAPGERAFVKPGQLVSVGDVLCIIESMKMMNQIEAERDGRLVDVLVEDGRPVPAGQPLFRFE